jgi:hypothetical protein
MNFHELSMSFQNHFVQKSSQLIILRLYYNTIKTNVSKALSSIVDDASTQPATSLASYKASFAANLSQVNREAGKQFYNLIEKNLENQSDFSNYY